MIDHNLALDINSAALPNASAAEASTPVEVPPVGQQRGTELVPLPILGGEPRAATAISRLRNV